MYSVEARNVTMPVYSDLSDNPAAVWRVEHIFIDHRSLGFFRVRLLPVLVADHISLECLQTNAPPDWVNLFHALPDELTQKNGVEWRDFKLRGGGGPASCLQATRALVKYDGPGITGRLEGMTLRSGSQTMNAPQARLQAGPHTASVTWQRGGLNYRWDLQSGLCTTNPIHSGALP
jgi:hypothetical protein